MSRVCHMLILKKSNFFFLQKNRETCQETRKYGPYTEVEVNINHH